MVNKKGRLSNYLEERRTGPDAGRGEISFAGDGLFLGVRFGAVREWSLRERSTRPSFCILSRFDLILSSLESS